MKILIISDTHGNEQNLKKVLNKTGFIDRLIHLGDVEGGEEHIRSMAGVPVNIVAGNNDFYTNLPQEEIIQLGNYRVMLTHGHHYQVYMGIERIYKEARQQNADIVMFGHTHCPCLVQKNGIWILNPGSLSLPRQEGRKPSYMIMEIDRHGIAHFHLSYLEKRFQFL